MILICEGKMFKTIESSSLELKLIGLTPKTKGQIVEPPLVSIVPPSPDGITYHLFVTGFTKSNHKIYALDCSCAQFGVFSSMTNTPFIASELKF